jgi:hypothetical protein
MRRSAHWHGTRQASLELLEAVAHNCTCRVEAGKLVSACAAHRMLLDDQRAIDGLLFARAILPHLMDEEAHP